MVDTTSKLIFIAMLSTLLNGCSSVGSIPAPVTTNNAAMPKDDGPYYQVKKGDTLHAISLIYDLDYRQLAQWNQIPPPYTIEIGQKLRLSAPNLSNQPMPEGIAPKIAAAPATNRISSQKKVIIPSNNKPDLAYSLSANAQPVQNIAEKYGSSSQKKSIISIDNRNMLKLNFQWPIKGKILKSFSQADNKGIDIAGEIGQDVSAAEAGKVVYSGQGLIGYGNLLIIKHNDLYLSAYANNSQLLITEGYTVEKGEVIAKVGRAGSNLTSLHFEIRKNGKPVNPLNLLPEKQ